MKVVVQQVSDGNITEGIILNIPRTNISGTGFEGKSFNFSAIYIIFLILTNFQSLTILVILIIQFDPICE
jgi:hypothetical protein